MRWVLRATDETAGLTFCQLMAENVTGWHVRREKDRKLFVRENPSARTMCLAVIARGLFVLKSNKSLHFVAFV